MVMQYNMAALYLTRRVCWINRLSLAVLPLNATTMISHGNEIHKCQRHLWWRERLLIDFRMTRC